MGKVVAPVAGCFVSPPGVSAEAVRGRAGVLSLLRLLDAEVARKRAGVLKPRSGLLAFIFVIEVKYRAL